MELAIIEKGEWKQNKTASMLHGTCVKILVLVPHSHLANLLVFYVIMASDMAMDFASCVSIRDICANSG